MILSTLNGQFFSVQSAIDAVKSALWFHSIDTSVCHCTGPIIYHALNLFLLGLFQLHIFSIRGLLWKEEIKE